MTAEIPTDCSPSRWARVGVGAERVGVTDCTNESSLPKLVRQEPRQFLPESLPFGPQLQSRIHLPRAAEVQVGTLIAV